MERGKNSWHRKLLMEIRVKIYRGIRERIKIREWSFIL
jgi:hypothetical protein